MTAPKRPHSHFHHNRVPIIACSDNLEFMRDLPEEDHPWVHLLKCPPRCGQPDCAEMRNAAACPTGVWLVPGFPAAEVGTIWSEDDEHCGCPVHERNEMDMLNPCIVRRSFWDRRRGFGVGVRFCVADSDGRRKPARSSPAIRDELISALTTCYVFRFSNWSWTKRPATFLKRRQCS